MYLNKKTDVKNWDFYKPEQKVEAINTSKICTIEEEVAYWRKANMIHNWFLVNCIDNFEDYHGEEVYIKKEKLKELYNICCDVIGKSELVEGKIVNGKTYDKEKGKFVNIMEDGKYIKDTTTAKELLPTTSGFFFGSQEYDEYYLHDIIETRDVLKPIIEQENDISDYYYSASW